jgi:hypothetical protein
MQHISIPTLSRRTVAVLAALVLVAVGAFAAQTRNAEAVTSTGYAEVANNATVDVRKSPNGVYYGALSLRDHFDVQYISPGGYAWGYAYGDVNHCGWVKAQSLDASGDSHGALHDCGEHHTIP